jgi:protein phosphatase
VSPNGALLLTSTASDVGKTRPNNEDFARAFVVVRGGRAYSILAVADGVGGGPAGELASEAAVEAVAETLRDRAWSDLPGGLAIAFAAANDSVRDITGDGSAATTLVVAAIDERAGTATIANVGDSRAYLVTENLARQITHDHSLVAAKVEAGLLTPAEARIAPDRNLLTRAVGSTPNVAIDTFGPIEIQPRDRLVLCTDGVHGLLQDQEIADAVGGVPIEEGAFSLVSVALEAGGTDNATAIVAGWQSTPGGVPYPHQHGRLMRLLSVSRRAGHVGDEVPND